jgi:hypothetical protein
MPRDSKPKRCHSARGGAGLGEGRVALLVTSTGLCLVAVFVEVYRPANLVWVYENGGLLKTARPAALVLARSI